MRTWSKAVWSAAVAAAAVLAASTTAYAQASANANINATVNVAARARITLAGAIAFADADPTTNPTLDAAALDVTVQARTAPAGAVNLTVLAGGNFVSGTDQIGIANLTWTSASSGFSATGTMDSSVAQNVGSWTGPGQRTGQQTYHLVNDWAYAPGNYTVTLTYTLTAP